MSRVRNISGGSRYVPLLDMEVGDGEVVDVPDFQPGHNPDAEPGDADYLAIAWPPTTWEPADDGTGSGGGAEAGTAPPAAAAAGEPADQPAGDEEGEV